MLSNILNRLNKIDTYLLFAIKKHTQNKYLDTLMPAITRLGNLGAVWIIIAAALLLSKQNRVIGDIVFITLAISTLIGEGVVKHLVRRIRPCNYGNEIKLLINKPLSYSFPSGHTLSSFAAAEVLSVYFTQYKLIFIGIAVLIALSRIYLYVHYPTDIIAGTIIGLLCSKLVFSVLQADYLQRLMVFIKI
ncbi:MAG: phosphatase PAP2 family protein [Bacillota bacterium]|nr:phosphatase PAP2 family protein [Bacillota bacterium]